MSHNLYLIYIVLSLSIWLYCLSDMVLPLLKSRSRQIGLCLVLIVSEGLFLIILDPFLNFIMAYIASVAILFLALVLFNRNHVKENLYIALWGELVLLTGKGITLSLSSLASHRSFHHLVARSAEGSAVRILGFVMAVILVRSLGGQLMELLPRLVERKLSYSVLIALMAGLHLLLLITRDMGTVETEYKSTGIFYLSLCVMVSILYLTSFYSAKMEIARIDQCLENEALLETQLRSQLDNYQVQAEYIKKVRAFKHDYLNQTRGLSYLLETKDMEAVKSYADSLNEELQKTGRDFIQYSNVPLIDAMLRDMRRSCEQRGIAYKANVRIKKRLGLTDAEAGLLFSNLLREAERIAAAAPEGKRFIEIESRFKGRWTVIRCLASCGPDPAGGSAELDKIQKITEEHDGFFETEAGGENHVVLIGLTEED